MAYIENKIKEINDPDLRKSILNEVKKLKETVSFGLVFEQHIPEVIPIYTAKIKPKSLVALKNENINELYRVKRVHNESVDIIHEVNKSNTNVAKNDLVAVKKFGEAIYPALLPVEEINNGSQNSNILIEADNFHALQLLEYIYPNKLDCIYIDPPYNTGSKDWKYNNYFVDDKDVYRHSKWLSFMKKRLYLAKNLLSENGSLIIAIDDYEVAHLLVLLEEIFPEYDCDTVVVNHHPQGAGGDNISRTHEYALFLTPQGKNILKGKLEEKSIEEWSLQRSGRDRRNFRKGRPNSFYAILVDPETLEIKGLGPKLGKEDSYPTEDTEEGYKRIYPISKKDGSERVWRYEHSSMQEKLNEELVRCTPGFSLKYIKKSKKKYKPVFSNWYGSRYNAGPNGTDLLARMLGDDIDFPYPKSLYTVFDALEAALHDKKDALVLDFFAGSGTTLNALSLLNYKDNGNRKGILVTNNEVSEEEAKNLYKEGYWPGDIEWEKHGIAKAITYPRCRNFLKGTNNNGEEISGNYLTGKQIEIEKNRLIKQLSFTNGNELTGAAKKQLVSLIDGIPQNKVGAATSFFVDEKYSSAILFDVSNVEEFLEEIDGKTSVSNIYIVTTNSKIFNEIKKSIEETLGPIIIKKEEELPISSGFKENLVYFKLDFLDPNEVLLNLHFEKLFPIIWMISGAKGSLNTCVDYQDSSYIISRSSSFAILLEEHKFREFFEIVNNCDEINNIFIMTKSEDAFFEMKSEFGTQNVIRLYHDYIKNFEVNRHWR